MKRTNTFMLVVASMFITMIAQAQNPGIKAADEFRNQGARQMVHKKNKETLREKSLREEKNLRKLADGPAMAPLSITFQEYDETSQQWINSMRYSYTYENVVYEKEVIIEFFEDDLFILSEKLIHHYNDQWVLQEVDIYFYEATEKSWQLYGKDLTHTDGYGNLTLEAKLIYDHFGQQWDTLQAVRLDYVYTDFGQPEEIVISVYYGWTREWHDLIKEYYSYDEAQRLHEFTSFYRDSEAFIPDFREEYFYNTQDEWSEILIYEWFFDEWHLEFKIGELAWFDFAEQKHLYYVVFYIGDDENDWYPYYRSIAEYHPVLGEQTLLQEEDFDYWANIWIPYYREITQFDENNMPLQYTIEYYMDDEWVLWIGIRNTTELNAQGYPVVNIVEWYDSHYTNTWIYWMKMLFDYDGVTGVPARELPNIQAQVYPNPVSNLLYVSVDQQYPVMMLNVFSLMGQQVGGWIYRGLEANVPVVIDLSRYQPGIYFVQVSVAGQAQLLKVVKR